MPRELEHDFYPSKAELVEMLRRIDAAGRNAAVHVVTRRGLGIVLDAFEALGEQARGSRIEHCGVCSVEDARRIATLGLSVVTQPGFIYGNGDSILDRLSARDLPDLYPVRRLLDAGVAVAASSDAPVIEPDPLMGLRGAVERRSRNGAALAPDQRIPAEGALGLYTSAAARVLGLESERGRIAPGLVADLVVFNQDPTAPDVDWDELEVEMTFLGGEVTFSAK
jgi:predicted amidohydrolase YtcJ